MHFVIVSVVFCLLTSFTTLTSVHITEDILLPYPHRQHGSRRSHRSIRECQPSRFGNLTHEEWPSHLSTPFEFDADFIDVRRFTSTVGAGNAKRTIYGHYIIVSNPNQTVSILEPGQKGGCGRQDLETVAETGGNSCIVAVNAGFYNVTDGSCFGNVVSSGRVVHDADNGANAHFGIRKDGHLFFGYVPDDVNFKDGFNDLVGGVIWLVRNGENYVDISKLVECPEAQSTSSLQGFIDVISARTAVGHDQIGRLVIVNVEGKTWQRGINLYEFADLMISFGVVNAINLDGGGSATVVVNGTVVNYPSDSMVVDNINYGVPRNVSTILCVHDVACIPADCSGHGECVHGKCLCTENWHGLSCNVLECRSSNCSGHGNCTEDGCQCSAGWKGLNCSDPCPESKFGTSCAQKCQCRGPSNGCSPVDGHCICSAGYRGYYCESVCPLGWYGENCKDRCQCSNGCFCDHVTGNCQLTQNSDWKIGQCFGDMSIVSRYATVLSAYDYWMWIGGMLSLAVLSAVSVTINMVVFFQKCEMQRKWKKTHSNRRQIPSTLSDSSSELDSDNEFYRLTFQSSSPDWTNSNSSQLNEETVPLRNGGRDTAARANKRS